jgi:DNA-binding GntR family transcriptional regulator
MYLVIATPGALGCDGARLGWRWGMARLDIPRVVKMPVEVQATEALRESIITGAIPAGARITEIQISEQMDLSRATVRTALHQLAKEGLLTLVPYTGWTVISLSPEDVWELYTLRSAVERLAAQLVAKTIDGVNSAALSQAYDRLVKECQRGGANRIAEADFALHKTIIELAAHSRLSIQYSLIEQQIRMYIRSSDALIPDALMIIDQHRPIVDAILAGDVKTSGDLSEQHNLSEGEKLTSHLRSLERPVAERRPSTSYRPTRARKAGR